MCEDEVRVNGFLTEGKKFCMNLFDGTCHERLSGTCSLLKPNQIQIPFERIRFYKKGFPRNDEAYCQCIARSLETRFNESTMRISIVMCKCGHYIVIDGQHRLCIASKLKIPLIVYISTYDNVCTYCREAHDLSNIRNAFLTMRGKGYYRLLKL